MRERIKGTAPPAKRNAARGRGGASVKSGGTFVASSAERHSNNTRLYRSLQRQAEARHERGPRPIGELLAEILDRLSADEAERPPAPPGVDGGRA